MNYDNDGLMIFFVSSLLALITLVGMMFMWRHARKIDVRFEIAVDVIFFFVCYKLFVYWYATAWFRFLNDYRTEISEGVDVSLLVPLYALEFVSYFIWAAVFFLSLLVVRKWSSSKGLAKMLPSFRSVAEERTVFLFLGVLYVLSTGMIVLTVAGVAEAGPRGLFDVLYGPLIRGVGMVLGPYMMLVCYRDSKLLSLFGATITLVTLAWMQTRGAIVYLSLWLLFIAWFVTRDRTQKRLLAGLVVVLPVLYLVQGGLPVVALSSDGGRAPSVMLDINEQKKGQRTAIEEIEWRFGTSTRYSTTFIDMYDRGDGAGIQPILNSLKGFMPRALAPEKPHPSTLNGEDIFSQGMYLVYREIWGYQERSMTEFSTAGHYYWEFGFPGVIVMSALAGMFLAFVLLFYGGLRVFFPVMLVVAFKPWGYVEPKIWLSEAVLQIYTIMLPFWSFVLLSNGVFWVARRFRIFRPNRMSGPRTQGIGLRRQLNPGL